MIRKAHHIKIENTYLYIYYSKILYMMSSLNQSKRKRAVEVLIEPSTIAKRKPESSSEIVPIKINKYQNIFAPKFKIPKGVSFMISTPAPTWNLTEEIGFGMKSRMTASYGGESIDFVVRYPSSTSSASAVSAAATSSSASLCDEGEVSTPRKNQPLRILIDLDDDHLDGLIGCMSGLKVYECDSIKEEKEFGF